MYPFVKSLLWSLNILKQANVEIDSTRLSLKGSPNDESMRYSATFSTASSSPVKRVRRVLSCEIKKWKFPQNDASKYQFPMTQIFSAIDRSIRPTHNGRLVCHYSRNEIRLMRDFLATDFFSLFFLHPKLNAKEFESIRQSQIALPQTCGREFDPRWRIQNRFEYSFPCFHFSSRNSEEGHVRTMSYVYRN